MDCWDYFVWFDEISSFVEVAINPSEITEDFGSIDWRVLVEAKAQVTEEKMIGKM